MLSSICIFLSCFHVVCLFLFGCLVYFLFVFQKQKRKKKKEKKKEVCVFVYVGTCVPLMVIETKFSKLYISCSLYEHLNAQLSK